MMRDPEQWARDCWLAGVDVQEAMDAARDRDSRRAVNRVWWMLDNQSRLVTIRDRNPLDIRTETS